jgi:hypothetical protein
MHRLKTTWLPFCPNLEAYGPIKCNRPSFVDAKLDGEYAVWFKNGIYNKNGVERRDFPAADLGKLLASHLMGMTGIDFENLQILGELHWQNGKAGDLYKLLSNKLNAELVFTVFDYFCGVPCGTIMDRRGTLVEAYDKAFPTPEVSLRLVPFKFCEKDEVQEGIQSFTNDGYEGVVVKPVDSLGTYYKFKSVETSDLKVLSADPWKARIGLEHPQRPGVELCGCKYDGTDRAGLVGKVVEIQYLQKLYNAGGLLTGLRNPSFLRVRDDKTEASL